MLDSWEGLGEDIRNHILCREVLELNTVLPDKFAGIVELNVDMLRAVVKDGVLRERDTALIVDKQRDGVDAEASEEIRKPDSFL